MFTKSCSECDENQRDFALKNLFFEMKLSFGSIFELLMYVFGLVSTFYFEIHNSSWSDISSIFSERYNIELNICLNFQMSTTSF